MISAQSRTVLRGFQQSFRAGRSALADRRITMKDGMNGQIPIRVCDRVQSMIGKSPAALHIHPKGRLCVEFGELGGVMADDDESVHIFFPGKEVATFSIQLGWQLGPSDHPWATQGAESVT